MKKLFFLCIFFAGLAACSSQAAELTLPTQMPSITSIAPTSVQGDIFRVEAWVDNPEPKAGELINISGSLIKNGVYLGGMMMTAYWPDEDDDRLPDCHIQVIYQRGICTVYASNFPVGEYTPVKVSFDYFGQTFMGETGFTREN